MYFTLHTSIALTMGLAVLAGGLLVRVFIIFHDCGHNSFFASKPMNTAVGFFTGVLTFTPFVMWKREHAVHHATAGDLDRRGVGDVPTMTVAEYIASPWWRRFGYRLVRNPLVLFGIGPLVVFFIRHRFAFTDDQVARRSVLITNLILVGMVSVMMWLFGWLPYLLLQTLVMAVAGSAGTWLFYVQHQFEGTHWERSQKWNFADAALKGSSFYKLPGILQWFSGNIGFHHIHHLSPRIPNYNLERCHRAEPFFDSVPTITLKGSFASLRYRLWDESARCLIGFRELRTRNTP